MEKTEDWEEDEWDASERRRHTRSRKRSTFIADSDDRKNTNKRKPSGSAHSDEDDDIDFDDKRAGGFGPKPGTRGFEECSTRPPTRMDRKSLHENPKKDRASEDERPRRQVSSLMMAPSDHDRKNSASRVPKSSPLDDARRDNEARRDNDAEDGYDNSDRKTGGKVGSRSRNDHQNRRWDDGGDYVRSEIASGDLDKGGRIPRAKFREGEEFGARGKFQDVNRRIDEGNKRIDEADRRLKVKVDDDVVNKSGFSITVKDEKMKVENGVDEKEKASTNKGQEERKRYSGWDDEPLGNERKRYSGWDDEPSKGQDEKKRYSGWDADAPGNERKRYGGWDDDFQGNEEERGRIKEDDFGRVRGRNLRSSVRVRRRSWSPDKKRLRRDSEDFDRELSDDKGDSDTERKGRDRDGHGRDDKKDSDWTERGRDWEGHKDNWKNRHHDRYDKEMKGDEGEYEFDRDWESHGRDRDNRRGGPERKDKGRAENVKNMSGFGDREYVYSSSRRNDSDFDGNWGFHAEERARNSDAYHGGSDSHYDDDGHQGNDQSFGMSSGRLFDCGESNTHGGRGRGHKGSANRGRGGNGGQSPFGNNQGSGNFNRSMHQGGKGGRGGRGGRGRVSGRDTQRGGIPLPMMGPGPGPGVPGMGPHFGPLGLPPGALQSMGPGIGPSPGPPMGPGGMFPPYPGPLVWGAGRGAGEMNMLPVPPGLSPVPPPGHSGPRFVPNLGPGPNQGMYFNQPGHARGGSPGMAGAGYGPANPTVRGMTSDKPGSGRILPRLSGPPGKAPSRGEQNDYSQNFVDTGMRPQNFIRELELTNVVEDYPKLRELIQRKDEIVAKSASSPMYLKCDLKETALSPELFGTKFDVILVDPPWEEYVHRAPGVGDHLEYWTFEEIQNLKIEALAENPSFIFLWVGDGVGLEQGRACLKKWGFRRCEDICWVKTNKANPSPGLRHDSHTLFQHSKEHCLMGIKGTVRRSTDGHIIHANIDTDIIIAEEPPHGSTTKPEDLYRIIEHFALGRRRLELFGEDHNIRAGWLTVGKGLSSSNFNAESYVKNFVDKEGKLWQGGAGRNPPPDASHLVCTTPDIESLRPKSPPPKSQQQQQANSLSQPAGNSANKKASATPAPQQNTHTSLATATGSAGAAQEVQASSNSMQVSRIPAPETRNSTFSTTIEQESLTMHSSTSRTLGGIGTRVVVEVESITEETLLDAKITGNIGQES